MEAWEQDLNFRERIHADANVRRYLNDAALERAFDLRRHVRYVDDIFVRVFGR
jgi:adenylosuccinate lyase